MPFTLPDHVDASLESRRTIACRHGLDGSDVEPMPETGIFNAIYRLGDRAILRIPRHHPELIAAAHREAVAVPAPCAGGVRTPRLLAFDDALDLLPVPYTVYERVPGEPLRGAASAGGSYA